MNLRILFLIIIIIGCLNYQTKAQKNIFDEVLEVNLRNMNEIESDGEVVGYYLFYKKEKISRKKTAFELVFLDAGLEELSSSKIIGSKYLSVLEGVYNSNVLLIKFIEPRQKLLIYKVFDNESKEIYKKEVKIEKLELMTIVGKQQGRDYEMYSPSMQQVGTSGFVDIGYRKKKYEVRYFDNKSKAKSWKFSPTKGHKIQGGQVVYTTDKHIVVSVVQKKRMWSTNGEYSIASFNAKSGSIISKKPTSKGNNNYVLLTGSKAEHGISKLYGSYYKPGENIIKSDPEGIISVAYDSEGGFGNIQKVSLSKIEKLGIQYKKSKKLTSELVEEKPKRKKKRSNKRKNKNKKSKKSSKDQKNELGNLFIHNIQQLANDEVIVIGEYFKKKLNGGAVFGQLLGSKESMTKMTINDLVILRLSPDFEILDVKNIEKNTNKCPLPNGALYYDSNMLGYLVKYSNGFSYAFSQRSPDDENILSIAFRDKGKNKTEGASIRILNIIKNECIEDKISLKTKASDIRVLKAKPGHVLITEYFKKDKKLNMRLEKINF